jgi:ABC-type lipoprotein export system ATPase subunit
MTPLLSLTDVGKSFWRGTVRVEVLRRVSLELAPGDFVAVWGSLGSGKTTLLRLAAGLDVPDEGEVLFEGRRIVALAKRDLQHLRRHDVGFADRSGPLERELTALDHVAFPLMGTMRRPEASRRAMEALRQLGLEPGCGALRWRELTDGERTLVSIAHAVVRRPKLLLVDDPTSNLGLHERERTVALLHRLASERDMAVLMTAPDSAATLGAHEVFTLSGGELLSAGRPPGADLIRLPGA